MLLGPVEGADTERLAADDRGQLPRPPLLHPRRAAADARAGLGPHRQRRLGRRAAAPSLGSGVYNMTKWGVAGFSEALRQEALHADIRVTVVEPGFVETELHDHNAHVRAGRGEKLKDEIGEVLRSEDIADAIVHALAAPAARQHQRGARAADGAAHLSTRANRSRGSRAGVGGAPPRVTPRKRRFNVPESGY